MLGLVDHLESAIERLSYKAGRHHVGRLLRQHELHRCRDGRETPAVSGAIARRVRRTTWDLGANTGAFSRIAADAGAYTVAIDGDPAAVERAALAGQARNERRILPLVMDLANPTAAMGWAHQERGSLADRGPADTLLALGLIHHLTLSNHVPFAMTAEFFARIGRRLVIEFVPPTDSQVVAMLSRMPKAAAGYLAGGVRRGLSLPFRYRRIGADSWHRTAAVPNGVAEGRAS